MLRHSRREMTGIRRYQQCPPPAPTTDIVIVCLGVGIGRSSEGKTGRGAFRKKL
jgi:hypothetical protein